MDKMQVRLIHTSDVHLGHNTGGDSVSCPVLRAMVDTSIRVSAHLMIIAGDLFDTNRVPDGVAKAAARELVRAEIPVVILPGNHDAFVLESVYRRVALATIAPNIHVLTAADGERISFPHLDLAVWGRPIDSYSGRCRPLAGIVPRGKECWQVAIAHGFVVTACGRKSEADQITLDDITHSGYDYIALGHLSLFTCVSEKPVMACYSGSASYARSITVVDLTEDGVHVAQHPLELG